MRKCKSKLQWNIVPFHILQDGYNETKEMEGGGNISVSLDVEKLEPLYIADGNKN